MSIEIEAKVATILDSRRLAINAGSLAGVTQGSDVVVWRVVDVRDPDSGSVLDSVRLDALRLNVVEVKPRICVAVIPAASALAAFGLDKPMRRIGSTGDERAVEVSVGDPVTIYVGDVEGPS